MSAISADTFASIRGISPQAAREAFRRCAAGGMWNGIALPVELLDGQRGGKAGRAWGLRIDLLPLEIRTRLGLSETLPSTVVEPGVQERPNDRHLTVARDRQRIIAPILATRKGSPERARAYEAISAACHEIAGRVKTVSISTLQGWVKAAEESSPAALLPQARGDRGKVRTLITREWDTTVDLPEDARGEIATEITKTARSMVANDGTSLREVRRICEGRLFRHSVASGSKLHPVKLRRICRLNAKWTERQDLERFRLIYLKNKDHKAYQDKVVARIRRELHPIPMGLLIGDVHYVDMLVEEEKEPIRVRLIHWMDASSLFVWTTPVFLSKGQGAGQEDVAESLFQVSQCRHGGIPQEYYLDNGSEYSAIAGAMIRLSQLAVNMKFGVTLAKPYSPTSKGEIEGHFHVLEQIFKGLPGWIAGDRTNKKTQNKGQVIEPYRKGLAELERDIQDAVAIYNDRPQSGLLDGLSPLEMLEQKIADTGFVARVPSEEAFDLIFSRSETRTIRQGTIEFEGKYWHTPEIDGLKLGARVETLIPLRKRHDRIFVRDGAENLGWAEPLPVFQHGDREGARLQARLEKGKRGTIKELEAQIDPTVSTFELQKEGVTRTEPNAPDPESWTTAINKTFLPPSVAEREAQKDAEARDFMEEYLATSKPSKREAGGGTRQTSLNAT